MCANTFSVKTPRSDNYHKQLSKTSKTAKQVALSKDYVYSALIDLI